MYVFTNYIDVSTIAMPGMNVHKLHCLINRIKTNRILAYLGMRCDDLIGVCFVFFSRLFGTFCWMILVHYKHEFYFFSYGLCPYALHVLILIDDIIYYWNHQLRIEQITWIMAAFVRYATVNVRLVNYNCHYCLGGMGAKIFLQ